MLTKHSHRKAPALSLRRMSALWNEEDNVQECGCACFHWFGSGQADGHLGERSSFPALLRWRDVAAPSSGGSP